MAETTLKLTITWENNVKFKLDSKLNDEEKHTIIQVNENAHLAHTWDSVVSICKVYLDKQLETIGNEMKG